MIQVEGLTRRFGSVAAVDNLSFSAQPGRVTGFLGPNGSGKSTTMRCIMGLDRIDGGRATVDGVTFGAKKPALHEVGALLDASYAHPGRSGRAHLRYVAASNRLPVERVDQMLEMVGLAAVGHKRFRTYSLGMKQRLGLAAALLGDPKNLILDEPANGLDPEGVRWVRDLLSGLAAQGRTILVSSHLLAEIALIADDLVVIGRGRLISEGPVAEFVDSRAASWVRVISPELPRLAAALHGAATSFQVDPRNPAAAQIHGVSAAQVGDAAFRERILLHELTTMQTSLEDVFLQATAADQEFRSEGIRQ